MHGLASNARLWDGVARHLASLGHRVVAIDPRGHGRSSKPDDGYDMTTVADDLMLLIDALGWQRPGIAGQSWGGNVVLELAHRHPDAVTTIACVDGGFIDLGVRFPVWDDAATALTPPRLAGTPLDRITGWLRNRPPTGPRRAAKAPWPTSRCVTTERLRRGSPSTGTCWCYAGSGSTNHRAATRAWPFRRC